MGYVLQWSHHVMVSNLVCSRNWRGLSFDRDIEVYMCLVM